MRNTTLRKKVLNNELTIGSWLTIGHPVIAEILVNAGFDWIVIDIEHTTIDFSMVQTLISIIQSKNIPALVRVSKNEEVVIKKVLDAGADGIILPMICSEEDAKRAVSYAKYPPIGQRGVGLSRAQQYGDTFDEYTRWVKENLLIIAQIEHIEGINNLEKIITVDGIDGTLIGPYDLSGSLGIPGKFEEPIVLDALHKYKGICQDHNFMMGFHVVNSDHNKILDKINDGYHFIAYGTDYLFLGDSAKKGITDINLNYNG